ncbi:MAG: general secretion pathway protein GspK [Rhodanobacteraceae bacterium]|nr:MAG: general secretion pathway protein GspK [Rhodanobacteraceae bacterium]
MRRRERGTALLLVLWATILLAALLVGVAAASRSHGEAALYGAERVRAELAAEAGLAHAVAGLRAPDQQHQWVPDGRPYTFEFDGARVTVAVVDVSGLVDLNATAPEMLRGLFQAAGADASTASRMADTVVAWRGGAEGTRFGSQPFAGGAPNGGGGPAFGGPFRTIDQLARLPGMDAALFDRIERAVTVFSGRNFPDASYAGALVLASLRGIDVRQATALVEGRRNQSAQRGAGNGDAFGAVANGPLVAGYGGVVDRVFSVAEMPDGTRVGVDATIRLALTGTRTHPYKVLDWRAD